MGATFSIVGVPGPKGSTTQFRRNSPPVNDSRVGRMWERAVMRQAPKLDLEPPYHVLLRFLYPTVKRSKWGYPVQNDLDKVVRCTLDGLVKAGTIRDDRYVIHLTATKLYAEPGQEPGVVVTVGPWGAGDGAAAR